MDDRVGYESAVAERKPEHIDPDVWETVQHCSWIDLVDLIDDLTEANHCLTNNVRILTKENRCYRVRLEKKSTLQSIVFSHSNS